MANNQDAMTNYYVTQAGGGGGFYSGIGYQRGYGIYVGKAYQKGYGLGSWLGGLFRTVLPLLKSGALAVGKEALRAGGNVVADLATGENFKQSVNRRASEAGDVLSQKLKRKTESMQGSGGIKRRKTAPKPHSVLTARGKRTSLVDKVW
jgi:hypothetical protein